METPIAQVDIVTGEIQYLHSEPQVSSVVAVSDAAGGVADTYSYDAYGNVDDQITTDPTHSTTSFGYGGQYIDTATGLYYLRARWMDPQSMTFLSIDPLLSETTEAYNYASGNPVMLVDPLGLFGWDSVKNFFNDADMLDTVSLGLSVVAVGAQFIPGPGTIIGGIAAAGSMAASARSAQVHIENGNMVGGISSLVGVIPGAGQIGGKLVAKGNKGLEAMASGIKKIAKSTPKGRHTLAPRHRKTFGKYEKAEANSISSNAGNIGNYIYTPAYLGMYGLSNINHYKNAVCDVFV